MPPGGPVIGERLAVAVEPAAEAGIDEAGGVRRQMRLAGHARRRAERRAPAPSGRAAPACRRRCAWSRPRGPRRLRRAARRCGRRGSAPACRRPAPRREQADLAEACNVDQRRFAAPGRACRQPFGRAPQRDDALGLDASPRQPAAASARQRRAGQHDGAAVVLRGIARRTSSDRSRDAAPACRRSAATAARSARCRRTRRAGSPTGSPHRRGAALQIGRKTAGDQLACDCAPPGPGRRRRDRR